MTMLKEDAVFTPELELLRPAECIDPTPSAEVIDIEQLAEIRQKPAVEVAVSCKKLGNSALKTSGTADITIATDTTLRVKGEEIELSEDAVFVFNALLAYKGVPKRAEEIRALGFREREAITLTRAHFNRTINRLIKKVNDAAGKPLLARQGVTKATRYELKEETRVKDGRDQLTGENASYVARERVVNDLSRQYQKHPYVQARLLAYRQPLRNTSMESTADEMGDYLKQIQAYRLLTKDDETQLFGDIDRGLDCYTEIDTLEDLTDEQEKKILDLVAAREIVFNTNLRLVIKIAMRYRRVRGTMSELDLIQEGNMGLAAAIPRMDISKGFKFSTYATPWIRQAVGRGVGNQSREIRLPVHVHETYARLVKDFSKLSDKLGRQPTEEEIVKMAGMNIQEYNELIRMGRLHLPSLNVLLGDDGDTELGDLVAKTEDDLDSSFSHAGETLDQVFSNAGLNDREKLIIGMRYGLSKSFMRHLQAAKKGGQKISMNRLLNKIEDGMPHSLADIGGVLGCSAERVRQLEAEALGKLRRAAPAFGEIL